MKKLLLLIILLNLTGCWNYRELNQLAITTGVAIDKDGDKFIISLMIANSKKQDSSNNEVQAATAVYSGEGETFYAAIKDAALAISKQVYLGHIELLVVSEEVAKNDMLEITDLLFRYPQTRNQYYLIIAEDTKAVDTLKITMPLESFPSQNITKNLEITEKLQGYTYKVTFNEFISDILSEGISPILPTVKLIGDIEQGNKEENIEQNKPDTYLKLGMMAIFKDDKLVTIAGKEASTGINLINGRAQVIGIQIACDDGYIVSETNDISTDVKVKFENGIPKIIINTKIDAAIQEVSCKIDLENDENIQKITKKSEDKIREYIEQGIALAKEYKTDIFGFGNKIYKKNYKYWYSVEENWDEEIFTNLEIEINPNIILTGKGSMNKIIEVNQ